MPNIGSETRSTSSAPTASRLGADLGITKRGHWVLALLALSCLLTSPLIAGSGGGIDLGAGVTFSNKNIWSKNYVVNWSGFYKPGEEICLHPPDKIKVPGTRSYTYNPPFAFTPTDLILISGFTVNGKEVSGAVIYDPPNDSEIRSLEIPCADKGQQVWSFLYVGETTIGPLYSNVPLAMHRSEQGGSPRVVVARIDSATGLPVINQGAGHCFVPTEEPATDPQSNQVLARYKAQTTGEICDVVTFGGAGEEEKKAESR